MKADIYGIRVNPTEEEEQIMLFSWAKTAEDVHPELRLMFHVPNGGKRGKAEAARFKAAGVKAGVPDICLPVARRGYHGLWIEMKALDGKPSDAQKDWIAMLTGQGHLVRICYGCDEAIRLIESYLTEGKR